MKTKDMGKKRNITMGMVKKMSMSMAMVKKRNMAMGAMGMAKNPPTGMAMNMTIPMIKNKGTF